MPSLARWEGVVTRALLRYDLPSAMHPVSHILVSSARGCNQPDVSLEAMPWCDDICHYDVVVRPRCRLHDDTNRIAMNSTEQNSPRVIFSSRQKSIYSMFFFCGADGKSRKSRRILSNAADMFIYMLHDRMVDRASCQMPLICPYTVAWLVLFSDNADVPTAKRRNVC